MYILAFTSIFSVAFIGGMVSDLSWFPWQSKAILASMRHATEAAQPVAELAEGLAAWFPGYWAGRRQGQGRLT